MTDINDSELEDLMAELEAQNAELAQTEKVAEPKPEPKPEKVAEPVVEKTVVQSSPTASSFDQSELDAMAELEQTLEPTGVDKLNAEQEVDLDSVFIEAEKVEIVVDEPAPVVVEPIAEVKADPIAEVVPEKVAEAEPEPIVIAKAEPRTLNIQPEPKPETEKSFSAKAAEQASELKYRPDVVIFTRDTKITDATLDQCMQDQASLMARQCALHAQAEAQLARTKQQFNVLEAGLYDAYRKKFIDMGEKATEKAIENAVRLDKKWAKASLLLIEAQTYADMHKGFVLSLRDRKDMLVQLGADRREEMKGQVRINNAVNPDSPVQQQAKAEQGSMASRAMEIARASMARA